MMRSVSAREYRLNGYTMTPVECGQVCAFIEEQACMLQSPLNMRLLINGYATYIQWKAGLSGTHWQDMLRGEIRGQAPHLFTKSVIIKKPLSRLEGLAQDRQIAREILAQTTDSKERLQLWTERTGLSDSTFYARRAEVEAED